MTVLATIPFTGTDGSDVAGFTVQAGTLKYLSNKGVAQPSAANYAPMSAEYTAIAATADLDAYLEFEVPAGEFYLALQTRTSSSPSGYNPNGYSVNFGNDSSYQLNWCAPNDSPTNLYSGPFNPVVGDRWAVRLRTVGTSIQSKAWAISGEFAQTEPSQWDVALDDTSITDAGYVGIQVNNGIAAVAVTIDNLTIWDADGKPVTPPVGGVSSMMPFLNKPRLRPLREPITIPEGDYIHNGRTFRPIVIEDFLTPADIGMVRQAYPDMGYYNGTSDTSGMGVYDPDAVLSVEDSVLDMYLSTDIPSTGAQGAGAGSTEQPLVAAFMPDNYTEITYGRAALCYRVTRIFGPGYKFNPLLFPIDNDWNDGEIDFVEFDINVSNMKSSPSNAKPGTLGQGVNGNPIFEPNPSLRAPDLATDWHVGAVEWTPDGVFFYHDGLLLAQLRPDSAPTTPLRFTIQAETWIGQGPVPAESSCHIEIDWVASYQMQ